MKTIEIYVQENADSRNSSSVMRVKMLATSEMIHQRLFSLPIQINHFLIKGKNHLKWAWKPFCGFPQSFFLMRYLKMHRHLWMETWQVGALKCANESPVHNSSYQPIQGNVNTALSIGTVSILQPTGSLSIERSSMLHWLCLGGGGCVQGGEVGN